jgi:hypothetical protein
LVIATLIHLSCSSRCWLHYDVEVYQLADFLPELSVAVAVHFYLQREPTRRLESLLSWVWFCVKVTVAGSSPVILATVARKFIMAEQLMEMIFVTHFSLLVTIIFVHLNSFVLLLRELK